MTLKGTSSLQRTTYFHLYFHDSMLIFQKQLISLVSGIIEFVGVRIHKKESLPGIHVSGHLRQQKRRSRHSVVATPKKARIL